MKYILKGDNNFNNPIETILNNRNISEELFNIDEDVVEDYDNYKNMNKGVELLLKHINKNSPILIVVDCDVDGYTSAAILYDYIYNELKYKNIAYIIHKEKKHGLSDDIEINEDVGLIILTDAGSNDYAQHLHYKDKGVDVLVIDHHKVDIESKNAIVINSQLSENVKNKNLSGAGVGYKFIKAMDDYLFNDKAGYYLDLVALGNIADVMSLREEETRYLCYIGMENINNTFIKALIENNAYDLEGKYNINKIGWTIAPKLNGMIRSGTFKDKEDMFKAFISKDYNYCLEVANRCKNVKGVQDREVKKELANIEKLIKLNDDDKCAFVEVKNLDKAFTGLVANKIQEKYGVPTLLYRIKEDGVISGSGRGNPNISDNFAQDLMKSELIEFAEGHDNSFGWQGNIDNLDSLRCFINDLYKDKEIINGKTYEVDFILDNDEIDKSIISKIGQYEDEWGNGIPEPLILFKNVEINITDDNIKGTKSKNMIFEFKGVKFIKKFLSNILKDKVLYQGKMSINIIGKCVSSGYNGVKYYQVEIVDMDI